SSSASGTSVALPAPGGAASTRRVCAAREARPSGRSGGTAASGATTRARISACPRCCRSGGSRELQQAPPSGKSSRLPPLLPTAGSMQVPPITSRYAFATTNHPANPVQLIDIGANLTHDSFDHDRDVVLQRAREAGVVQMVVTGASREHSPQALELARAHPGELFATAGVHPHHATEYAAECDVEMRALHAHPEVVAVGECGLDYF